MKINNKNDKPTGKYHVTASITLLMVVDQPDSAAYCKPKKNAAANAIAIKKNEPAKTFAHARVA